MGGGGEGREMKRRKGGKGRRGDIAPNFNSWRRHCMKGVRAPVSRLILTLHFVNPGSAPDAYVGRC